MAAKRLQDIGYKNVSIMKDGLSKWQESGYPVEKGGDWFPF